MRALVLVLTACGASSTPPAPVGNRAAESTSPPVPATCDHLRGTVIDELDRSPLAGVSVAARDDRGTVFIEVTDSHGRFHHMGAVQGPVTVYYLGSEKQVALRSCDLGVIRLDPSKPGG